MNQSVPETDLREFLRTRRARITPQEAGLTAFPGVRRVPGLRREEVAQLAGVSLDYYVRLERGRSASVSDAVLEAVARVLKLDDDEREHLFALARPGRPAPRTDTPEPARPGLLRVLDNITNIPALLLSHRLDVLATNHLARALYLDFDALPVEARNIAHYLFLNPAARDLYADWPETGREIVGMLHFQASRHPHDPQLPRLIGQLSSGDPDFRRWWANQDIFKPRHGSKHYRHPLVGDLILGYESFTPTGDPHQTLGLYTVETGSPSEHALSKLAMSAERP
ncbi:helix-turn-helix transcriptional regulator [Arthrobacter sp. NPDC057013]|uniref:helix-turn-helix transcriptional regulator n=1 Tax=Arthrobacter sp. NPDC057013 TaxID=3345999 RepID=UPI0036254BAC